MNIVLTGFMASGKTEISKKLAEISGYRLVDTDEEIIKSTKMSINEIFDKFGEGEFRRIEREIIKEVSNFDKTIISTGGGVPLDRENIKNLRKKGVIVNLAPSFDVILERLNDARATRPLLKDSDIADIEKRFNERLPFYADCDIKIAVSNQHPPIYFAKQILNEKLIQL